MITIDDIRQARDAWVRAVERRNVDEVVALYDSQEAVLLGTVDTDEVGPRKGVECIRGYFKRFLANDEVRALFSSSVEEAHIEYYGDMYVAYSGYYAFTLVKDGGARVAHAKFTYVYKRVNDKLFIVLHNSGLTPRGIEETMYP